MTPAQAAWRYLAFRAHTHAARREGRASEGRTEETAIVTLAGGIFVELDRGGRPRAAGGHRSGTGCRGPSTCRPADLGMVRALEPGAGRHRQRARLRPQCRQSRAGRHRSGRRTRSRSAAPATPRARSITSSRRTFRRTASRWSRSTRPSGNWSSWPPHKHDVDDMPNEAVLEEIYYYAFRRARGWATPAALPRATDRATRSGPYATVSWSS